MKRSAATRGRRTPLPCVPPKKVIARFRDRAAVSARAYAASALLRRRRAGTLRPRRRRDGSRWIGKDCQMATLKRWVLRRRPDGDIQPGDLELVEEPIRDLADGEVLVRTLYLSLDPTNRIWMSDQDQYMPPVGIGDTMRGGSLGVVESSRSDRFKQG